MAEKRHRGVYEKVTGSNVWWIRYTDATGMRRKMRIGSLVEAVKAYDRKSTEARSGIITPRASIRFETLVDDAIAFAQYQRSAKDFEQRARLAADTFGNRIADSITTAELQKWMLAMAKERNWTPGTQNRVKSTLSTVWREAQRAGKALTNPARLLRRAKEPLGRVRFLSPEEEASLRAAIMQTIVGRGKKGSVYCQYQLDVALHTGMRRGEQFSVTWDQVDLNRGFIYLSHTKNGSDRYVHLNSKALETLKLLWEVHQAAKLPRNSLLFFGRRGEPITDPKKWFMTALRLARIEGVTWHTLRHTFASRLVMAGVDLKTVQDLMGHKTIAMTARYAHLSPVHKVEALERLVGPEMAPDGFDLFAQPNANS